MAKRKRSRGRKKMNLLDLFASWLLIIGGLNWGLEAFNWNLVGWLADLINFPGLRNIVYAMVGASAIYFIVRIFRKFK